MELPEEINVTVSLDAMGGDLAPESIIKGAALALEQYQYKNTGFIINGDEALISPVLAHYPKLRKVSILAHTDEVIANDAKPAVAIRKGRNSSMGMAIQAVKKGKAHCAVSAGNTGALMAMSKIILRTLPGIDRPAIGSIMPTSGANSVMLDLGANIYCDANNLFEFAVMGDAFARALLDIDNPSIGLLNIGSEDGKGNEVVKSAASMIKDSELSLNFYGFIEGDDIGRNTVDVIVTDGFSGNVALKTAEGTAIMLSKSLKEITGKSFLSSIGALLMTPAFRKIRKRFDPRLHNGAMFLGLNGIVVKSHGGSDEIGAANAIKVAVELTRHEINRQIMKEMMESGHISPEDALSYEENGGRG